MMMLKTTTFVVLASTTAAFVVTGPKTLRPSTSLNLEDHIADMIDNELYRQRNKEAYEKKAADEFRKSLAVHVSELPNTLEVDDSYLQQESLISPREKARDRKLAREDPQAYCANRCVSTGNCEVFEDMFEMGPEEVVKFCDECVLSEEEEPCDVPEAFLDPKDPLAGLAP